MERSAVRNAGMASLESIISGTMEKAQSGGDVGLIQGLKNIASMTQFNPEQGLPRPIPGMGEMVPAIMAFRRANKFMNLAVVGGKAPVFHLPLEKLVLIVERLHDRNTRTVIVQNCSDAGSEHLRGQILARINPDHSAIHVVWGALGRAISDPQDVSRSGAYYVRRDDLAAFYLAAKAQLKGGSLLEELLQSNEGWREYDLPTNPLDPGAN